MVHISVKRGLDIPLIGSPTGEVKSLPLPKKVALDLSPFEGIRTSLLVKEGEEVLVGQPIAEDKGCPGRFFPAPAAGRVVEIIRGLKRRIIYVVIETSEEQQAYIHENLLSGGIYTQIRCRPCAQLAHPEERPKSIFVKALESAPFAPPPELEVIGYEAEFAEGLKQLGEIAPVHLIHREGLSFAGSAANCHTVSGPHPAANPSIHIAAIDPIRSPNERVWTVTVHDVVAIGHLSLRKQVYTSRVVSIAGESIPEEHRGYVRLTKGYPIGELVKDRALGEGSRLLAGDPLTGRRVSHEDFLSDGVFCAIPEESRAREAFHFLRLFKYSATRGYWTVGKNHSFTTNQHGEERAFVDGAVYDKVMPLKISTMLLIKAILAEEYERAASFGLLEVDAEDFALPAFICPSKIDLVGIARVGLQAYADQYLSKQLV